MNGNGIDNLLQRAGIGRLPLDDPFFSDTYEAFKVFHRVGITVEDDEDLCHRSMEEFQCNAPNCDAFFRNLADYEVHYNGSHRYTCEECKTTRPNARLLEIHIQETHDSFFEMSSRKRPMYQCYVVECDARFADPQERSGHCAAIHWFPENFRYESRATAADQAPSEMTEESEAAEDASLIPTEAIPPCNDGVHPRFVGDGATPWFAGERHAALRTEGPTARLARSTDRNYFTWKIRGDENILENGGLMDLLNELPDRRVGDET